MPDKVVETSCIEISWSIDQLGVRYRPQAVFRAVQRIMAGYYQGFAPQRLFQLLLLAVAAFGATYGRFTLGPLQEVIRESLQLSDNQIAWLQGPAVAVPMAIAAIPVGLLVDRYPRAPLFFGFAALSILATAITASSSNIAWLILARFLAGTASAAMLVATFSLLCDLYEPTERGRATAVIQLGEVGGAPTAFALGGTLLAMASPANSTLENWRWALLWMSAPIVPIMCLLLMLREPTRKGVSTEPPELRLLLPQIWAHRTVVLPLLLARVLVWIADGAVLVWAAPVFSRRFAMSAEHVGASMAGVLLMSGIIGPVLGGLLADRCQRLGGSRRTMGAICVLAFLSVPPGLFALLPDVETAILMLALFLLMGVILGTAAVALASVVIPGELRGLYMAINVTVGACFSIGVAPLAVSALAGILGGPSQIGSALAIVCTTTSFLGATVFGAGCRYYPGKESGSKSELASTR